jgi:uncharacterized C2H2 Zn-finger protein
MGTRAVPQKVTVPEARPELRPIRRQFRRTVSRRKARIFGKLGKLGRNERRENECAFLRCRVGTALRVCKKISRSSANAHNFAIASPREAGKRIQRENESFSQSAGQDIAGDLRHVNQFCDAQNQFCRAPIKYQYCVGQRLRRARGAPSCPSGECPHNKTALEDRR